ncbi:MAG TPA: hypothetical protein VNU49_00230 [Opitutaceae bacterium]|jgi:hypothetical protein|nr:hypothetical protein [Opitutaceae bacterium]
MKKILFPLITALALFAGRAQADAATVPLVNLAGDDASLVIYVTDMPALVKTWPATPWMKMWHDDQVQKYFAPLRGQMKLDEWDERCKANTGYAMADLLNFATGEAILVMPDLGTVIAADKNKADPPLLFAVEIGGNESKIEKLIADEEAKDKEKKFTETTEDFDGVTLHIVGMAAPTAAEPQHPGIWAIANGVFYACPSKDFLQQTLAAAKQGGHDNALGKSDGFMQMRQRTGDAQLIIYANLKAMYPAAQKAIAEQKAAQNAGQPPAMSPFDPTTILRALGLDAANEFYLTANIGQTSADIISGLTYRERRGLTKLIEYADGAPPRPKFVPEKCFSVLSMRFSIKNAYATIEGMLGDISPLFAGMFEGYVKSFNDRLGIDLKRDLLGNLGDQFILASALDDAVPADAPLAQRLNQLYAISLENDTAFTTAVEALKRGLFADAADKVFEKRAYLGHDIYTYAPPQPPAADGAPPPPASPGFSYAVADHWVFLGSAPLIENALQGLDGQQASFWDKAEVKRNLLADMPDDTRCLSYVDLGKIMPVYFDAIVQGMEASRKMAAARAQRNQPDDGNGSEQTPPADTDKPMVDDSAKPDADTLAKYWGYSRAYYNQDAHGTYSTGRIIYPNNP